MSSSSADSPLGYNGPGSKWDVILNADNTFEVTVRENANSPIQLTVNGDYSRATSGFTLLTVDSATGNGAPNQGDIAYALEVPGYAFMLRPLDADNDQITPMIESGACPSADFNANWVVVKKSNNAPANDATRDFFGTFSYDATLGGATIPSRFALASDFASLGSAGFSEGTCNEGLMFVDDAQMYLTSSGGGIVQTSISDEDESNFIFALPQDTVNNIANLDGDYSGLLFDKSHSDPADRISPVYLSCLAGACTGQIVTDVTNGTLSNETVNILLGNVVDTPSAGFVTGTIGAGSLACMVDLDAANSGKNVVNCVGQSPGSGQQDSMFNVLLVSR